MSQRKKKKMNTQIQKGISDSDDFYNGNANRLMSQRVIEKGV